MRISYRGSISSHTCEAFLNFHMGDSKLLQRDGTLHGSSSELSIAIQDFNACQLPIDCLPFLNEGPILFYRL